MNSYPDLLAQARQARAHSEHAWMILYGMLHHHPHALTHASAQVLLEEIETHDAAKLTALRALVAVLEEIDAAESGEGMVADIAPPMRG